MTADWCLQPDAMTTHPSTTHPRNPPPTHPTACLLGADLGLQPCCARFTVCRLCIPKDAVTKGQRVLLIDDLVATGGTLAAGIQCVKALGGEVIGKWPQILTSSRQALCASSSFAGSPSFC